jgi:hypothetical protein
MRKSQNTNRWQPGATGTAPPCAFGKLFVFGCALLLASLPASGLGAAQNKPPAALEGTLLATGSAGPILKTHGKERALSATTPYLFHTLEDKRLDGREVHVEGTGKPDGSFEVQWLYTIQKGKLFRVRYYCRVCNIVALEPGPCVCCQQPTELQEIPAEESRP